jgi:hypothetical protein
MRARILVAGIAALLVCCGATLRRGGGNQGAECSTDSDCSQGLKCCYPCGIPNCHDQCLRPEPSGRCPLYP